MKLCFEIARNKVGSIRIYCCSKESDKVSQAVFTKDSRLGKFRLIVEGIFRNQSIGDRYAKYEEDVSAFKLSKGRENIRIYCKVQIMKDDGVEVRCIILSKVHSKTSEALSKKEKSIIKGLVNIEYECKQWIKKDESGSFQS